MKKLFRIKLEHESFVVAENEQEAEEIFYEEKEKIRFLHDIMKIEEIDEVEGHNFDE